MFSSAYLPFTAVTTDIFSGKEILLNKGNMVDAIRASIAIPGVFTPAKKGKQLLVDGGLVNPLPVDVVKKMGADIIIAVDLNNHFIQEKLKSKKVYKNKWRKWFTPTRPNTIDIIESSIFMMEDQLTQKNLIIHKPDFLIQPKLDSVSIFDFYKAKGMIQEGYDQTKKLIPKIKKLI